LRAFGSCWQVPSWGDEMGIELDVVRRMLTRHEIERRVTEIEMNVMRAAQASARAEGQPVWISPAELVRRMWPYLGLN